eukprot:gene7167-7973_t
MDSIAKLMNQPNLKVIVHGMLESSSKQWVSDLTNGLLQKKKTNVLVIDWGKGALSFVTGGNSRLVGAQLGYLLKNIFRRSSVVDKEVHVIGFSLGAHIAGYAAKYLIKDGYKLGRITGLDPGDLPFGERLFDNAASEARLDENDADFIDNIHTDTKGLGMTRAVGHLDFYPNGGAVQPGCGIFSTLKALTMIKSADNFFRTVGCNHIRAVDYFIASLSNSSCKHRGYPCSTYGAYKNGNCKEVCKDDKQQHCPIMGYDAVLSKDSMPHLAGKKLYLDTTRQILPVGFINGLLREKLRELEQELCTLHTLVQKQQHKAKPFDLSVMEEAVQVLVASSNRFAHEQGSQQVVMKKYPEIKNGELPVLPLCEICGDKSTGRHYKVFSCEGCKNFFRRSVRRSRNYKCPAFGECAVDKSQRTRCRACRMMKCLKIGMRKEAVQCERKPLALTQEGFLKAKENQLKYELENPEEKLSPTEIMKEDSLNLPMNNIQQATPDSNEQESKREPLPDANKYIETEQNNAPQDNAGLIRPQANLPVAEHAAPEYNSRLYVMESSLFGVFPFSVDPPSMPITDPGYLYELSTRLLFASVDWTKGLLCFSRLCEEDRLRLMVEKWYLLFALGLLQCSNMFPVSTLLSLVGNAANRGGETSGTNSSSGLKWETFVKLKCVIMSGGLIGRISKEIHEYMKIVTLFDQGVPGLIGVDVIYDTRKRAQIALETVLADSAYNEREVSLREKIVYALEGINKINKQEIKEAFFELILKETSVETVVKSLLLEQA